VYGPKRVYIEKIALSDSEIMQSVYEGLRSRARKLKKSDWKGYETDHAELKKISYKLDHGNDGWGLVAFKNDSNCELAATITLTGTNLGRCKGKNYKGIFDFF
jgi:hypothetical protein